MTSHHERVLRLESITTARLVLMPLDASVASAVADGDFSRLVTAAGWPHDDTIDAIRTATATGGSSLVWLVTLDGLVIGDCGTVGGLDETGAVEIGYGLAAEYRGHGYGTELVVALSESLLAQAEVEEVNAREVLADNVASRRVLEKSGFALECEQDGLTWYALRRR